MFYIENIFIKFYYFYNLFDKNTTNLKYDYVKSCGND